MTTPFSRHIAHYGWVRDLPDHRDHIFAAPSPVLVALPSKIDLRPECPKEIYDQGQLGSCTANAIACAIEFDLMKEKAKKVFTPSRLFIYYNERAVEGTVSSDSGAQIRDGIKQVNKLGVCPETDWPYSDNNPGPFQQKPPAKDYTEALNSKVTSYKTVTRSLSQFKGCLASGFPFVFGITVYESFESAEVAKTGTVPMPSHRESVLGGHAIIAVGYDDSEQRFIIRNSWGKSWGMGGYFTLPYAYLLDTGLSDSFWTLRTVED